MSNRITARTARIAICAGSQLYAQRLAEYLECDDSLRVAEICNSPRTLMRLLERTRLDLVVLELDLPRADSVAMTRRIVSEGLAKVILFAPHWDRRGARALSGLDAGACGVFSKASIDPSAAASLGARALRLRIKCLAITRSRLLASREDSRVEVIGVCASTGGPAALNAVLSGLPAAFTIPVLVVQHMTPGLTDELAAWLDRTVAMPVAIAQSGASLAPGVWFAPEGADLVLNDRGRLAREASGGAHRPSGDMLLSSLARVAGAHAAAVVLSGMGSDGAVGLAAVAAAGGHTFAQDEDSSAVYGMPRAAAELGSARVLDPQAIGDALAAMDRGRCHELGTDAGLAPDPRERERDRAQAGPAR
jgi:two-component system chemotaxis response regulator CheB